MNHTSIACRALQRVRRSLRSHHRPTLVRLRIEALEVRTTPTVLGFRSIDGTGNNLAHPEWGSAGSDFVRQAPAQYGDGISTPAGSNRPSAREISNVIVDQQGKEIVNSREMSAMVYAWGQFVDHDLDLMLTGNGEEFDISVPTGDPWFDPNGTGAAVIPLVRSAYDATTGTNTPRQQTNAITSWLDGSAIYGSDDATALSLRTLQGGRLKTSAGNLLPMDGAGNFLAGDTRVNENPELTSMQTMLLREHNRIADQLHHQSPNLSDEEVYQRARAQVIAEIQAITYNEWLPALLGPGAIPAYRGYNPNVNPGIANEFAAAGFRMGHSLLGSDIEFIGNDGREVADEVSLADAFFNPAIVKENGISPILKYLASDPSSEVDTKVVDEVRNFLFGPPGAGGMDLASLNIQRGRDHGLGDYNSVRAAYGLPKATDFKQITSDPQLQQKLKDMYGTVNNIDLWVGALAENHVQGGSVGPTLRAIVADQFVRLRSADRFWYQREFSGPQLRDLQSTTLTSLIRRNTDLTTVQKNAFFFHAQISGRLFADPNRNGRPDFGEPGIVGRTVELVDLDSSEVVATTTSGANGRYEFHVADGLRTGRYEVRQVLPTGVLQTTPPRSIAIVSGDTFVTRIDLGSTIDLPPV